MPEVVFAVAGAGKLVQHVEPFRQRLNAEKRAIVMPATETVGMNLYGSNRDGYAIARFLDAQRMSSQPI